MRARAQACARVLEMLGPQRSPPLLQPAGMPKPAGGVNAGVKTLQKNEERPSGVSHFYHTWAHGFDPVNNKILKCQHADAWKRFQGNFKGEQCASVPAVLPWIEYKAF